MRIKMKDNKELIKIKKYKITEEKVVAIVFLAIIFSTLIFTVISKYEELKAEIVAIFENEQTDGYGKVVELTEKAETVFNEQIYGKDEFVDVYGLVQKILFKSYLEDSNDPTRDVVKLNNGMLTFLQKKEDMVTRANHIAELQKSIHEEGIPFIYIQAPYKIRDNSELPTGVADYANENADVLLKTLNEQQVETVDLREYFKEMPIPEEYFITDHHWKIKTAFEAVNHISDILNNEYNFNIDSFYTDINHYHIITQKNAYLGSIGKRNGRFYGGLDDFEYIVPNFETQLSVNKSGDVKNGSFEDTIIVKDLLGDDILLNKYACYFGGDFPEIVIQNETSMSDKKVLVIQDSYGLPFSSFLSLRVKELRTIDLRHFEGKEIEYIKEYKPDIVLMIYNPSSFYIEKNFQFE